MIPFTPAPTWVGIDVSKDWLDCWLSCGIHRQFANRASGFKRLLKQLSASDCCALEATGTYHLPLAHYLHGQGRAVSVINPVVVKRFAQMRLRFTKTDKADAQLIAAYAALEQPSLWQPTEAHLQQGRQLCALVADYHKQITALQNQQHALKSSGVAPKAALASLKRSIAML
jgi:transposase